MKPRKIQLTLVALLGVGLPDAASACTNRDVDFIVAARERGLIGKERVVGAFVLTQIERLDPRLEYPARVHGVVTTAEGRTYRTVHDDDGTIVGCPMYYQPFYNVRGTFYLKRVSDGEYALVHWTPEESN